MPRKLLTVTFVISFFTVFSITNLSAQQITRVKFAKGKSTHKIVSTLGGLQTRTFILGAKEGQSLNAKITSTRNRVIIDEEEGATNLTMDTKNGDNKIYIRNKSRYRTKYTIVFTIKNKPKIPPTRIAIGRNEMSKTINLEMNRYKKSKQFVFRAGKNETITLENITQGTTNRVYFGVNNEKDVNVKEEKFGSLRFVTKKAGDLIIDFEKIDEKYLSAKIKITFLSRVVN